MVRNLEDAVMVLNDAIAIRDIYYADPDPEAEAVTEESIIAALLINGASPYEVLQLKDIYTRAVRKMIAGMVDQQG